MASTFAEMNGASIAAEDCNTVAHMDPTYSESDRVVPGFAKEKTIVPRTKPDATNPAALSARNSPEKRYMTPLQLRSPDVGRSVGLGICALRVRILRTSGGQNPDRLFRGGGASGFAAEGRHDVAREAADIVARAAEIDHDVFDAPGMQRLQFPRDVVRGPEQRGVVAQFAYFCLVMRRETLAGVARPLRQPIDPHMPLEAPLQCRAEIGLVARDVHGARDPNLHRVEGAV